MKKISFFAAIGLLLCLCTNAQNLAINTDGSSADVNAILDVKSNNKGILIPRMSSAARLAITPTKGLLVYDETTQGFWYNTGTEWKSIASTTALATANAWLITGNSGTDSSNFLGTLDNVPLNFRVNNIPSGRIDHIQNNTAFGYGINLSTTSGNDNTALGMEALHDNASGDANTATGFRSLFSNTTGGSNTANGWGVMYDNINGFENTGIGGEALRKNIDGSKNTGIGHIALYSNTSGSLNTALGASALYSNTTGLENTAAGANALYANTAGQYNTAIGSQSMKSSANGSYSTALGHSSLAGNTGGPGINTAIGYMSMGSGSHLENVAVGAYTLQKGGDKSTAIGTYALFNNTTGSFNTAIGMSSLYNNTGGVNNNALGYQSMFSNTTGSLNVSIGDGSMYHNTTGLKNVAVGIDAMNGNTTAQQNTAAGYQALGQNEEGWSNTAFGFQAATSGRHVEDVAIGINALKKGGAHNTAVGAHTLSNNTGGQFNTAAGWSALTNNVNGSNNVAIGTNALWSQTNGFLNIAVGDNAMYNNLTGVNNTAIGRASLSTNTTGSWNTAVGYDADVSAANLTNATAIGNGAIVDASNKVRIGNSAVTVIEGQVPFTTPSDGRFKFNVQEDVKGLDFILQLRPVTYQFDVKRFDAQIGQNSNDNTIIQASYNAAEQIRRTGFIAQEVEKAAVTSGYNFSGVIAPQKSGDHYSLSYDAFVVPLVKAVQEQQQVIEVQSKKIADLQQQLDEIKKMLQQKK